MGLHTTGVRFNSERRRRGKKKPVIYLALLHVCSSARNLTELKRKKVDRATKRSCLSHIYNHFCGFDDFPHFPLLPLATSAPLH